MPMVLGPPAGCAWGPGCIPPGRGRKGRAVQQLLRLRSAPSWAQHLAGQSSGLGGPPGSSEGCWWCSQSQASGPWEGRSLELVGREAAAVAAAGTVQAAAVTLQCSRSACRAMRLKGRDERPPPTALTPLLRPGARVSAEARKSGPVLSARSAAF